MVFSGSLGYLQCGGRTMRNTAAHSVAEAGWEEIRRLSHVAPFLSQIPPQICFLPEKHFVATESYPQTECLVRMLL